jgi:hypothetical protein
MLTLPKLWWNVIFSGTATDVVTSPNVANSLVTISFADAHAPADPTQGTSFQTWSASPYPGNFVNAPFFSGGFANWGYLGTGVSYDSQRCSARPRRAPRSDVCVVQHRAAAVAAHAFVGLTAAYVSMQVPRARDGEHGC